MTLSAANIPDLHQLEPALEAVAPLQRPGPGRPVKRPAKLHADKADDARWCGQTWRRRGIQQLRIRDEQHADITKHSSS